MSENVAARKFRVGGGDAVSAVALVERLPAVNSSWTTFPAGTVRVANVRPLRTWPAYLRRLEDLWRRLTGDRRWEVEIEYRIPNGQESS